MQVDTNVAEADVGRGEGGSTGDVHRRRVSRAHAFVERSSRSGRRAQVLQNVVTYDVVVSAPNNDQVLPPTMTANVRIVTDQEGGRAQGAERARSACRVRRGSRPTDASDGRRPGEGRSARRRDLAAEARASAGGGAATTGQRDARTASGCSTAARQAESRPRSSSGSATGPIPKSPSGDLTEQQQVLVGVGGDRAPASGDHRRATPEAVTWPTFLIETERTGEGLPPSGSRRVHALRGVSVSVHARRVLAVMGPSGSGKSTFMNLLGCLDTPTRGRYRLDGVDVSRPGRRRARAIRNEKIGFVFQTFNLLARTTALDNVELPLLYAGLAASATRASGRARALAGGRPRRARAASAQRSFPAASSSAWPSRARSSTQPALILLADEPTGALDTPHERRDHGPLPGR